MAVPSFRLIQALRETADRLERGADYAWGNHGCCNCGNLLQVISHQSGKEILRKAHTGIGEWTELAEEYCGVTNLPADQLVGALMEAGLNATDIHDIEYLDNREVLDKLPGGFRWLQRNLRADVISYFRAFADLLEERMESLKNQERKLLGIIADAASVLRADALPRQVL
jgi:hypothetical protein